MANSRTSSIVMMGAVLAMMASPAHANVVGDMLIAVPEFLMKVVTAVFILLAAILYVGQYLFTQIMVKIGILMMPIMVPFIMLEKTRFLFEGWTKFMITAGVIKIVGAVMFGILASNVKNAVAIAQEASDQQESLVVNFSIYAGLLLLTGLTAYIMSQTQQIGNGLISGGFHGGFRFSPTAVASSHTRGLGQGAGNVANRGAGGMAGAAGGAVQAYKAGQSAGGVLKGALSGGSQGLKKGLTGMTGGGKPSGNASVPGTASPSISSGKTDPISALRNKIQSAGNQSGRRS